MTTGKAVLIVVGVAAAGFVAYEFLKPSLPTAKPRTANRPGDLLGTVNGIVNLADSLSNYFKGPTGGANTYPSSSFPSNYGSLSDDAKLDIYDSHELDVQSSGVMFSDE